MKNQLVSVIVPTKNSSEFLDKCLKSIRNQTYKNVELIVVDNNSTDDTKEIAKRYTKLIFNKGPERSSQRNLGAQKAKGKYLLFIDSDMVLTPNLIKECVELVKKNVKAIIIPEISVGEGFWAKCRALEKLCYIGDNLIEAARFFEKNLFWQAGGWDEKMVAAEDWDLTNRVRKITELSRIISTIKHNEGRIILRRLVRKKYYYGTKLEYYIKKNKDISKNQFTLIRKAYIKNWGLFFRDPIHYTGMLVLKSFEFIAGGFGLLVSKIGLINQL
ncbi:glycosyltransferase [Candidatus Woesearchaeota archaeon]|nr:glycosyltransferase [Candidatus Woesearchaeota archaeon]